MLLLSNFKDYYDYMIGITGVDEKIVYNRGNIKNNIIDKRYDGFPKCPHTKKHHDYYILSICGKKYTLICDKKENSDIKYISGCFLKWSDLRLITMKDLEDTAIYSDVSDKWYYWFSNDINYKKIEKTYEGLHNKSDSDLIKISKEINTPVFLITSTINIYDKTPILSQIGGIPGMLPADKLFHDICYFISNTLNNDKEIIEISNKNKILKAGFDLKTSFRKVKEKCQK